MKTHTSILVLVAALGLSIGTSALAEDEGKEAASAPADTAAAEKAATAAAETWLAEIDAGKYAESWTGTSKYFQRAVPQKSWVKALEGARDPLGKLESRKLESTEYRTTLPGAPDGQYVIASFQAKFADKADGREEVTLAKGDDGAWKPVGYYIK